MTMPTISRTGSFARSYPDSSMQHTFMSSRSFGTMGSPISLLCRAHSVSLAPARRVPTCPISTGLRS